MSQFYSGKYKNERKDAMFRPYDVNSSIAEVLCGIK